MSGAACNHKKYLQASEVSSLFRATAPAVVNVDACRRLYCESRMVWHGKTQKKKKMRIDEVDVVVVVIFVAVGV